MDLLRRCAEARREKGIVETKGKAGAGDSETELSREYIIEHKPKPKVVKQYLAALVEAMLEDED